jgi:CRISPR-associated RAMP protein, Cmr4 family
MIAKYYTIKALTNMHVGSGETNTGVIDNQVQRDVVTDLPTINGSSLKGALKEFFEYHWKSDDGKKRLNKIFGDKDNAANYRFLSADLLTLPLRSNKKQFYLATAPMAINKMQTDLSTYAIKNIEEKCPFPSENMPIVYSDNPISQLLIEDFNKFNFKEEEKYPSKLFSFVEQPDLLTILSDADFKTQCNESHLPVIARNNLEGSGNLWYEQQVPRESIFGFIVIINDEDDDYKAFNEKLTAKDSIIHIGANATVGQGFTKITAIQ